VTQLGGVVGVSHRAVGAVGPAQRRVELAERPVAAGEQVQLGVAQARVAGRVSRAVLVAQEPQPASTRLAR